VNDNLLVAHPSDQMVFDSPYRHSGRRAYLKAYQAQERQQKLDSQRTANTVDVSRSSSRFNPPSDPAVEKAFIQRRASHVATGGVIEAPKSLIPFLDATSESQAKDGFFFYSYKHHTPERREEGLLRFARALHLLPFSAVFQGKDDAVRQIALRIITSPEAVTRFAEKGWTA
jgi:hypothetical protein